MDEDTASKAAAANAVGGSIPSPSAGLGGVTILGKRPLSVNRGAGL
jgi:hypothetical protein